ncbi:MAG: UvrD-helicase domain-containing protein [Nitrospiria bacterium]
MTDILNDQIERDLAATTFDQNVVVTAGAGTGKTSLLVNRLVHLLMREPEPIKITEVVALTFTNKAANEMKTRLREELESYINLRLDIEPKDENEANTRRQVQALIDRYHLSKELIDARASHALRQLERSEIGTIHSFAATLLRLYPLEAGVDPDFKEGEETALEKYFEEQWAVWLDSELSHSASRKEKWKKALGRSSLEEIHDFALSLCSENVPLKRLDKLLHQEKIPMPVQNWLKRLEGLASDLNARHPGTHNIEVMTLAAGKIIKEYRAHHMIRPDLLEEEQGLISSRKSVSGVKGWEEEEVEQAKGLIRVTIRLLQIDRDLMRLLHELLVPFVASFRDRFLKTGSISFDGLLVRARNLVRDRPSVREELKKQYRAILIDEFQDTDPVQYEILLYLSEEPGQGSKDWRKVQLEPGKVFVVGDPKQSIYGFRRADIEAYLHVVEDLIEGQNGIHLRLTTNFRSHERILNVVNGVFDRLILQREGSQPPYVGIKPPDRKGAESPAESKRYPFRNVALRCVKSGEEKIDADHARRLEGEAIARWLSGDVLGKVFILDKNRSPVVVQRKDVAILMRTLTDVHHYLEPLKRSGIRYVVEGEKRFFGSQEVIDAVNLLRVIEDPEDTIALVGVLRSPVGGLNDAEIYELRRWDFLDYRLFSRFEKINKMTVSPIVKELYECLYRLHQQIRKLPVGEAVARVFEETPITILAAQSIHGEQAVANLEKIRRVAQELGEEGHGTLKEVIAELTRSVSEMKEEGESALAEETVDAVKIFSMHKAKGLEFPVVVLAGCHTKGGSGRSSDFNVMHDWFTDLVGLHVGETWDLSGIYLAEKERLRDAEEQKRVLYVAMTRAREHLMISCAPTGRGESGSFLSMLGQATGDITVLQDSREIPAGEGLIEATIVTEELEQEDAIRSSETITRFRMNWKEYATQWKDRMNRYEEMIKRPFFLTPTSLKQSEMGLSERAPQKRGKSFAGDASLIGRLAHQFLQEWDFSSDLETFRESLTPFLGDRLTGVPEANRPAIRLDLEEIFQVFFRSTTYEELRHSNILGREIPFLISWEDQIMEGVIDLIYEMEGNLYVADYKTDRVKKEGLTQAAEDYRHQARIYPEAVSRSLQRDVSGTKLIFLRIGEAIQV